MSLVSSLLGVAGGELIIPTLAFAFRADIKTAGPPCPLVGLPTVAGGLMVGLVPAVAIKLVLGVILIFSRSRS